MLRNPSHRRGSISYVRCNNIAKMPPALCEMSSLDLQVFLFYFIVTLSSQLIFFNIYICYMCKVTLVCFITVVGVFCPGLIIAILFLYVVLICLIIVDFLLCSISSLDNPLTRTERLHGQLSENIVIYSFQGNGIATQRFPRWSFILVIQPILYKYNYY